ncbi:nuclear transport factor 2 family protein [Sandaracinobacter sp. RS1-74]|uniref:SnoaL-like domain-containing protein n=1 Tax=Sandaracinobacteroides sayramensis TaxID=2913411 RepID=UPI001ED9D2E6|nr:SnoaL-like domain-containing protein [Sandaracinobacteroides sayramensis]MCG2840992.1 nuclear transport factor 2 family protein [Sandaracinobacteroides sayramensis]
MDVRELAADYAALLAAGKMEEAARKYWAEDVVTREAMPGEWGETRGRAAAVEKGEWWVGNHEVHAIRTEGPFVNGDSFLIIMELDVTPHGGERTQMREIVGYKVADDRVVEERYFY